MSLNEDSFLVITGTGQPIRDRDWIIRNLIKEDHVFVTDVTGTYAVISLAGPKSRELLNRISSDNFSNEDFPYYTHRIVEIGSTTLRAARLSYIGELGWELYIPSESALAVFDEIQKAGASLGLKPAGTEALSSLRIEKGFRAWGHEISSDDTPIHAGLESTVKFNKKQSFIGKEALMKIKDKELDKRLMMFTLKDSMPGEPLLL